MFYGYFYYYISCFTRWKTVVRNNKIGIRILFYLHCSFQILNFRNQAMENEPFRFFNFQIILNTTFKERNTRPCNRVFIISLRYYSFFIILLTMPITE